MTEKRIRGYAPRAGRDIARTWAIAHGSAWVLAADLMEPPGIFSDYAKFQVITRALERVGVPFERQPYDGRTFMYRLSPETVKELTYGGKQ
jgi:hypothetical protein